MATFFFPLPLAQSFIKEKANIAKSASGWGRNLQAIITSWEHKEEDTRFRYDT